MVSSQRLISIIFIHIFLIGILSGADKNSFLSDYNLNKNSFFGFIKNENYLQEDILFYSFSKNQNILVFKDKIVFDFHIYEDTNKKPLEKLDKEIELMNQNGFIRKKGLVISMEFIDFNNDYKFITENEIHRLNIFKGSNVTSLQRRYEKIKLINIYDNVDLILCFDDGKFRFDLFLKENANPNNIKFKLNGVDEIKNIKNDSFGNQEKLQLISNEGSVFFGNIKSFYYNKTGNDDFYSSNSLINTEYSINSNIFSFVIENYDKTRQLIIDPVVYSTFFGGLDIDDITGIAQDKNDDLIITGWSRSENFRTTPGAYDTLFYSETDCFISKFRLVGANKKLMFSTLIGGNADEYSKSISLDPDGNIFIAGETESFDYPVRNTPYSTYAGLKDGFISKFNNDGSKLLYSSYFGGTKQDRINSIAVGGAGEIYITGGTYSSDLPVTIIYNDNNPNNKGLEEAFVTKLYSNGSVQYSFLLTSLGFEYGSVIALNEKAGMLVVAGQTNSPDLISFPKTGDNTIIDYVYNGGQDIFLAMFTPGLGTFNFCTFIGGSGDDLVSDILIDDEGNIFISGQTSTQNASINPSVISTDFRLTNTSYQKKNNGGFDAFLLGLNRNATKLLGSTFLGGKNNDNFLSMDFNSNKTSIYLTGFTQSPDFPRANANDNEKYVAKKDIIISNLSLDCSKLLYSSIIGASGDDMANCIVIDRFDGMNLVGSTNSRDFPLFEPLESIYLGGTSDGFIYRKLLKTLILTSNLKSYEYCQNENIYLSWLADGFEKGHRFFVEVSTNNGLSWAPIIYDYERFEYIWKIPADFPAGTLNKIRVFSPSGMVSASEGNFTVLSSPRITRVGLSSSESVFCEGDSVEILSEVEGEQLKFQWEKDGKTLPGKNQQNLSISLLTLADEGNYALNVSGKCKPDVKSSSVNIQIKPKTEIISDLENLKVKLNENIELFIKAKGLKLSYEWQRDGIKMFNQTDSVLRLNNVNLSFQGYYRCIISGECGTDTSNNVFLEVDTSTTYIVDLFEKDQIKIKTIYNKTSDEGFEITSEEENSIDLILTDLNGKNIYSLVNYQLKTGYNLLPFNMNQLSAGLYTITIFNKRYSITKLILILI